jgi:hypothetical protein
MDPAIAKPGKKKTDAEDGGEKLKQLVTQLASLEREKEERDRNEILAGPAVDPSEVLARDPETGQRTVHFTVTATKRKIGFRAMTRGDWKRVPEEQRQENVVDWPEDVKAQILANCLAVPALPWPEDWRDNAQGLVQWCDANLGWADLDDFVVAIFNATAQPKMRVPDFRPMDPEGREQGKAESHPEEPPTESLTNGSTDSATLSSDPIAATDSH